MATTTNYGWATPDDTDLVKDGAAAIRTLGSSIDSTTEDLNPATTEGDLQYRGATVDVNERLAIGTAGQLLAVNSGEDAPEWVTPTPSAAATTLLSTTTLSGTTVTIGSIPQTFKHLNFVFEAVKPTSGGAVNFNTAGVTSVAHQFQTANSSGVATNQFNTSNSAFLNISSGAAGDNNMGMIHIPNYTLAIRKIVTYNTFYVNNSHGDNTHQFGQMCNVGGLNAAVSSVTITAGSAMAGTVKMFGVN